MAAFLGNLRNVVIAGFVLALGVLAIRFSFGGLEIGTEAFWAFIIRWAHIICGVMWIGLLWYFNFVQIPTMPKVPAELKGGVTGYIAPEVLAGRGHPRIETDRHALGVLRILLERRLPLELPGMMTS